MLNNKLKNRLLLVSSMFLISLVTSGCVSSDIFAELLSSSSNATSHSEKADVDVTGFDEIANILKENWYSQIYYGKDIDRDLIIDQFVGALSSSDDKMLDPYTYLIKNETVSVPLQGKLGITISLYDGYPVVINVDKTGAAYGYLHEGDIVLQAGSDRFGTRTMLDPNIAYNTLFTSVLAEPGSNAYVKVARFDELNKINYLDFTIKTKEPADTIYSKEVDCDIEDTLMVALSGFTDGSNGTANQLKDILAANTKQNIIIDLRDNPGGDLGSVIDVCDLFLPKDKTVCYLEYVNGNQAEHKTRNSDYYGFDKIVILQNDNTASASEILISTLTYYYPELCTLVGTKSYGKGIASTKRAVLNKEYYLNYTCAKWLRPDKSWIGMTIDSTSDVGFYPKEENLLNKDETLLMLDATTSYIDYKENDKYIAYKEDKVASQNQYFFFAFNELYNKNVRTDGYFDANATLAIKEFQESKGLEGTGIMNQATFLYFVKDYYDYKASYAASYLSKAESIILGD